MYDTVAPIPNISRIGNVKIINNMERTTDSNLVEVELLKAHKDYDSLNKLTIVRTIIGEAIKKSNLSESISTVATLESEYVDSEIDDHGVLKSVKVIIDLNSMLKIKENLYACKAGDGVTSKSLMIYDGRNFNIVKDRESVDTLIINTRDAGLVKNHAVCGKAIYTELVEANIDYESLPENDVEWFRLNSSGVYGVSEKYDEYLKLTNFVWAGNGYLFRTNVGVVFIKCSLQNPGSAYIYELAVSALKNYITSLTDSNKIKERANRAIEAAKMPL